MSLKKNLNGNNKTPQNRVIVILGPTASGKTELSISLARKIGGEIISADSMQVYRKMNIGTAKTSSVLLNKIPHYLINIIEPDENFSAGKFKAMAELAMGKIFSNKKTPIISGGTGLYIKTLTDGLCESPPENMEIRAKLVMLAQQRGNQYLYSRLLKVDRVSAENTHMNNIRRVIRAIEVFETSGISMSSWQKRMKKPYYNFIMFGLNWDRDILYGRIDKRVEEMFNKGFIKEVEKLLESGYGENLRSMQSLGYKHIIGYLHKHYDMDMLVELVKRDTRRYAKRQLTWWRNDKRIHWLDMNEGIDKNLSMIVDCIS
jgi:tRNA dimethylallyltransferase